MEIANRVSQFQWKKKSPTFWEEEVLFFSSDDYFRDMILGLDLAQVSISFETYIFQKGYLGDLVFSALERALARKINVKILVDGVGSPSFWQDYGARLQSLGAEVRLYRAWPWQFQGRKMPPFKRIREFFSRWYNLNKGNHRKTCLVDNQIAWIGSCNISDVHLKEIAHEKAWLDACVRVRGTELRRLAKAFSIAFKGDLLQSPFQSKDRLLFLNNSFLLRRTQRHDRLRRLKKAQRRVWLQTPYFVPIRPIYARLRSLAKKGVDVRLMVPAISDVPLIRYMSFAYFESLLKSGVRIFEYQPRFMHQKITQIDSWVSIGSSNLNHRSFFHDLEIDVVVTFPDNQKLVHEKFLEEQKESTELQLKSITQSLTWTQRWLGRALLLLRYFA